MIKLRTAAEILQNAYLYMINEELNRKPKFPSGKKVVCCKCGNGNTTLRKLPDGQYICNNCFKEKENADKD